ncbi:MAG: competence protein CoiA family protein [Candidatus Thorarchaeota archaeon]
MKEVILKSSSAESFSHKTIKHLIYESFFENTNIIAVRKIEKYLGIRFADIYFRLISGEKVVIEIQNSKISVKELKQRTEDYNHLGIYVLWLIHGEGNCIASKKYPFDAKEVRVSPVEKFLHQMYGGRVYYINLNMQDEEVKLTKLFALHFTKPIKKSKQGIFKSGYERYFYRDVNFTFIPNWNLLCTGFNGYKIARFFDKNIKSVLKGEIENYIRKCNLEILRKKKQINSIVKQFNRKYGEYMILNLLIELVNDEKLMLGQKVFKWIDRKIMFNHK